MEELQGNKRTPLSVFISYAHEDELWRQRLEAHLSLLRRQGLIADWYDRQIMPGAEWAQEIDEHVETASIILLLISADFVASDYCYDKEMQRALERHKLGEARVIPIILRPCDWQSSSFARLQSLPRDGKAVTTWQNQDEAFLVIAQGLRRVIERQQIPARPFSHVERQNRTRLMKRVRATWTEGVLEHSLHQAALIALDLQEQPDALANPWRLEVQETSVPPHPLPAATSIVQVYDEADGELLLLGEPGAGKTTLLLELTRALLERAEQEERHCLPVVFNLSSWAQKRQPFAEWLVEELSTKYQVPRKVGKGWIAIDQILPLLDGLDEVAKDARSACVKAINAYYQDHLEKGAAPLVVCCRSEEYMALQTRVTLQQAVTIQPLTDVQIEAYLQSTKGQLEALRQALHHDPGLNELAHRPLMLSIFTLAYQGAEVGELPSQGTREAQQQQVFATYVERLLQRRAASHYAPEQTKHWLAWLAQQMVLHSQTEFYLERMQPDWLQKGQLYRLYRGMSGALLTALLVGLVGLLLGPSMVEILDFSIAYTYPCSGHLAILPIDVTSGIAIAVLAGLVCGLLAGLCNIGKAEIRPVEIMVRGWRTMRRDLISSLIIGVIWVLCFWQWNDPVTGRGWFTYCPLGELTPLPDRGELLTSLITPFIHWVACGLVGGLVFSLANGFSRGKLDESQLVALAHRRRSSFGIGFLVGLTGWLVGGRVSTLFSLTLFSLFTVPISLRDLVRIVTTVLIFGLVGGLLTGLVNGFSRRELDKHYRAIPNQGIWRSARTGGLVGLLVGLVGVLIFGSVSGLILGLVQGLSVGLLAGLLYGGIACIKHVVLRLFLWRAGYTPWNYSRFLDYAAEHILLRKVGGGYILIHRLLLDYFASLEKKES